MNAEETLAMLFLGCVPGPDSHQGLHTLSNIQVMPLPSYVSLIIGNTEFSRLIQESFVGRVHNYTFFGIEGQETLALCGQ